MFTELQTGQWHRVQMYYTEFRSNRLTNVEIRTAAHFYHAVKCGCHWAEFHETRKCKQNFVQAPCTGCVYLTAEFCARPTYRMCVSHCRILCTPHVPDVCISLQNSVHAPCTGCVYLTAEFCVRPMYRMCVSHCRILCTPHVPYVCISLGITSANSKYV